MSCSYFAHVAAARMAERVDAAILNTLFDGASWNSPIGPDRYTSRVTIRRPVRFTGE